MQTINSEEKVDLNCLITNDLPHVEDGPPQRAGRESGNASCTLARPERPSGTLTHCPGSERFKKYTNYRGRREDAV